MAKRTTTVAAPIQEQQPENEAQAELVGLMRAADDAGVQIVEEQWRALSSEEQGIAASWVNARRTGSQRPIPGFLRPFASEALLKEFEAYHQSQAESRIELMPCEFDKPSVTAPGEDETEGQIKMSVKVAFEHLPGGKADRLLRYKKCRFQFSLRSQDAWRATNLPNTPELPRIYEASADVSGYKASRHFTTFGFLVPQSELSIEDAFHSLWGCKGSVAIEVLGEAVGKAKHDDDDDEPDEPAPRRTRAKPAAGPQLNFDGPAKKKPAAPVESQKHNIALTANLCLDVNVLQMQPSGRWSAEWKGLGPVGACGQADSSVRASAKEALIASIGNAVAHWSAAWEDEESKTVVARCRKWLSAFEAGKTASEIETQE